MTDVNLPPSSKTVLALLDEGGAMTHKEIVKKSNLAPRTVRYALKKLKENQLIIEKFNFRDARQIIYQNREQQLVTA
ncbi:MAG TPA: winged helix-turn-helix transcriptional regulator [Methanoregulaceae archaeon]|jgi:predicted transcriptional regulator|nr:winged helix-turn-helix transcriptional regulator [Methanolinea sp.]MCC7566961.1 winged helix-turn-helix transcriptional regulator [Methanoregulaceae archaeon]MDD3092420.1 winged helix-turn-helix transcriptional regulator [Methanoregulaceae archaeon]MDD5686176.1 winged helix-turn-helix transcriptional regulator [Methanoregulaceae archaeon]MDD5686185.1 winged helix-turn-helix transcriptional regulator [Methanoregulaceae archaeon]